MGAFSDNLSNVATTLLTKYGESISVTRDNVASYTVSTGAVSDSADTTYTGYGHPGTYTHREIDGVLVQQKDIRLLFKSTTAPLVNDIFTVNSKVYTAISVQNLRAQGSDIIWIVQLRQ